MTSSTAPTSRKAQGTAPFSSEEWDGILEQAERLASNPEEFKDDLTAQTMIWYVVLCRLIPKSKGPSASSQITSVIDKLMKIAVPLLKLDPESFKQKAPAKRAQKKKVVEQDELLKMAELMEKLQ